MSETMDKKVEMVRSFFKKEQPKNHPIKNHPLEKCEEYVKNLYIDMMCVFAMYDNDDTENQNRFIERIIYGVGDTLSIADHIKRAMEITVDKVSEFIKQIQDNDIKDIFFIDALIISCANGSPTKKQTEFLAEFADMLSFAKDDIQFVCEFIIGILEQDFDKLLKSVNDYEDIENYVNKASCYIKNLTDSKNVFTDSEVYCYSLVQSKMEMFSQSYLFQSKNSVTLENIVVDNHLGFKGVKTVTLKNCIFENINGYALGFEGVENVNIENCIFRNLEKAIQFHDASTTTVSDTIFKDFSVKYNSIIGCSAHHGNNMNFKNCLFENIVTAEKNSLDKLIYGSNGRISAVNCKFYNCVGAKYLFANRYTYESYTHENCEYIGCCSVCN